jgi:hypothetical protein
MRSKLIAVALFVVAVAAFAQSDRGTITGTITDQAGAVVAAAAVEAKNVDTGAVFPAASTGTGNYTIPQLPVGNYEISATVPGFKKYVRTGIAVQVAQTLRLDMTLEVGSASESISVSAEASLLKTETADVSQNVNVSTLNELPIMGVGSAASGSSGIRNPNNVVNLVPGTYYVPNSQVKINGAPTNSQSYRVEGMDATNQGFPYAAAQTQPSVDAIQEISVQTSNFAAEFGIVGGGFFNVTMRSGGNQYHGSAYDYLVNEVLNAGTPFTNSTDHPGQLIRPRARRNDYGFTLGGPVSIPKLYNGHDKTFFFFNYEQFREVQIINNTPITVPTAAYRNGDFSNLIALGGNAQLKDSKGNLLKDNQGNPIYAGEIFDPLTGNPFPGNIIPKNRIDPVAAAVQALIPLPSNPNSAFNNLLPTYPSDRVTSIPALKIDHMINDRQRLAFYWSLTRTDSNYSPTYGQSEGLPTPITATRGTHIHSQVERLNYDNTLSPTLLLHIGVGYQQNIFVDDAPVLDYNAVSALGLKGATLNRNFPIFNGFCPNAPGTFTAVCTATGGMANMGPSAGQTHSYWEKPAANASVTWVKENHTYKAGFDGYVQAVPTYPFSNTAGAYTFSGNETALPAVIASGAVNGSTGFPYASFLLGAVDQYNIAAPAAYRQSKKQMGLFAQDSWKVSRKLTLSYGVRWDYGTYYKEEHGRALNFSFTTPNPSTGNMPGAFIYEGSGPGQCNCDFAKNYPWAFAPRLGAAYQINPKTVVRAGWGIIYGQTSINSLGINSAGVAATTTATSPGLGKPATTLSTGIPVTPTWPNFSPGVLPLFASGGQALPTGVGYLDPQAGRPPRQNQWSIGIEREITPNLVVEAAYVGNRGVWWQAPSLKDINAVTPQILANYGLNIANGTDQTLLTSALSSAAAIARGFKAPYAGFSLSNTVAQSIRPFPQFSNIPVIGNPMGKTWYDSLQIKATKRLSHGLNVSSAFTWQKSQQVGVDGNANPAIAGTNFVNNVVGNPYTNKSIGLYDQPFVFVVAASYQIPKWAPTKVLSYALKDWQIGTLLQYSSGLPIPTPAATTSLASQLFQPTLMERVAGQPLYNVDLNCHCFDPSTTYVLNPKAWVNPAAGTFSDASPFYGDFRYQRHPMENLNFGRTFRFKERMSLNLRAEFSNIFNRTYLNNPSATTPLSALPPLNSLGQTTGGYGFINRGVTGTQFGQPRAGTIVVRFQF